MQESRNNEKGITICIIFKTIVYSLLRVKIGKQRSASGSDPQTDLLSLLQIQC